MSAQSGYQWNRPTTSVATSLLLAASLGGCAVQSATGPSRMSAASTELFSQAAEWPVVTNDSSKAAEILAASEDEQTLLYTDSPAELLGFVDISDPTNPSGQGVLPLGGEPTSVAVRDGYALVAVNTSESYANPSGHVAVVDMASRQIVSSCDVGGQPDSVAVSADGAFLVVAVENERDEDLNDGALPQYPAGHVAIFDLKSDGTPANCDAARIVDVTGLAEVGSDDPEPEYVSINGNNVAAVTLQENNHVVLIDLASGEIAGDFSTGTVDLENVDLTADGTVSLTESAEDVPREPDAVAWIDESRLVTANEGDYEGGGRSFTVFDPSGAVMWDSGSETERVAAEAERYPDKRSPKKGTEPETVAVGNFGGEKLVFVALERGNSLLVYKADGNQLSFQQLLATGVGPEGVLPLPERDLVVVANEADPDEGLPSTINIFQLDR